MQYSNENSIFLQELEEVIRKKTEAAIKKLEHQFKAIYMKYGSIVKKQDEKKAESYLEGTLQSFVNQKHSFVLTFGQRYWD